MKKNTTKRSLLASVLALAMCVTMLVGTTFAWFTDSASTSVSKITAGNLHVQIQDKNGDPIDTLKWLGTDGEPVEKQDSILWEPNCTYRLTPFKIVNTGNLALKYKIVITGLDGDNELLDVIHFTYTTEDGTFDMSDEGHLAANGGATKMITVSAKMDADAGNKYMGMTLDGVTFTVYAAQDTVESDSNGTTYDALAEYPETIQKLKATYAADASSVPAGFVVTQYNNQEFDSAAEKTGTITIKDAESLLYFAYVLDPAAALANEPETVWPHTSIWYGGAYDRHIVLDADIDLQGNTLPTGFGNMKSFTFDGQGHTIKNVTINYAGSGNVGLFTGGNRGISNLVVENVKVIAPNTTNAVGIVSSDANATIENVTVRNSSVVGGKYTGAIVGYNYGSVINCTVENCTVIGRYKVGGVVGYICNSNDYPTSVTGNTLTDVTVKGENLVAGKDHFVIGKIVGNWDATVGACKNNNFDGTTTATDNIGEVESRCIAGLEQG